MLKRFLFILLLLGFVISVPYDVFAAPRKETKKERRERRERGQARRKKQQPKKKAPKPTFEEKLTPAQVDRKIQSIRRRIETAPESVFPAKDKRVFLEVFDDMAKTQMGRGGRSRCTQNLLQAFCLSKSR